MVPVKVFLAILFALLGCLQITARVSSVWTQHYDIQRTGSNPNEEILTHAAVSSSDFKKLFSCTLEREIAGQVLYVADVSLNGTKANVLYFWTNSNADGSPVSHYAFDADSGKMFWHVRLNATAQFQTATPVIDTKTNTMYFVTKNYLDINPRDSGYGTQLLHAIDTTTGNERAGSPIIIDATVKDATGAGSKDGYVRFRDLHSNTRPGLLFLNNVIYFGYAYNTDAPPYHGWLFGYIYDHDKGQFTQHVLLYTTPGGSEGGIWQGGKGIMSDGTYLYITVGNGEFNATRNQWGMCVLKLSLELKVLDYYVVPQWQSYSNGDLDTGNAGPLMIPGTKYLFVGPTKYAKAHVLDTDNMGKWISKTQDTAHQTIVMPGWGVPEQPVAWEGPDGLVSIYVWTPSAELLQFKFDKTTNKVGLPIHASIGTSGGALSVSSNGVNDGILWAQSFDSGNMYALDATDVSKKPLWSSPDGSVTHFGWPVVANGKVYFGVGGGGSPGEYLIAFGLSK